MKAVLLRKFGVGPEIEKLADPACPRDGAVIAPRACGVCRSDHHAWKGLDPDVKLPLVMGHEFAGEVIETGLECRAFRVGDRVTAPFILSCGACADCRGGEPTVCDHQRVLGFTWPGAYAQAVAVPQADFNLARLPDEVAFEAAACLGCRTTTAFRGLIDRGQLAPGEWVAVHGCGGVGLSAVAIAAALGASVVAIDINPEALARARELGATYMLDVGRHDDVGGAVRELTAGGAHLSIDALGSAETLRNSLRSLRKLGRHVQLGMPVGAHARFELPLLEFVYARQISIAGSRGMAANRFGALFEMVVAGRLDPARLVTGTIALSGVADALARMDRFTGSGITLVTDFEH
jgi:alcohol dehydrogenase